MAERYGFGNFVVRRPPPSPARCLIMLTQTDYIWRTRVQPIRTASEINAIIIIPIIKKVVLYKLYARKAKQLHTLGMSFKAISRSLKISQETARKAYRYKEC